MTEKPQSGKLVPDQNANQVSFEYKTGTVVLSPPAVCSTE